MTASNTLANFPSISAPIALPNGQISPAWQQLLIQLFNYQNSLGANIETLKNSIYQPIQDAALIAAPLTQDTITYNVFEYAVGQAIQDAVLLGTPPMQDAVSLQMLSNMLSQSEQNAALLSPPHCQNAVTLDA